MSTDERRAWILTQIASDLARVERREVVRALRVAATAQPGHAVLIARDIDSWRQRLHTIALEIREDVLTVLEASDTLTRTSLTQAVAALAEGWNTARPLPAPLDRARYEMRLRALLALAGN